MRNGSTHGTSEEREKLNIDPGKNGVTRVRSSQQFNVIRRVYQQDRLNQDADYHEPVRTWKYHCRKFLRQCGLFQCLKGILPIIFWLPKYKFKEYAVGDLISGATTAVMHIPQVRTFFYMNLLLNVLFGFYFVIKFGSAPKFVNSWLLVRDKLFQGMAYALLAEVAPVVGLYMAFFPVLVYVLFGTSPHISLGTFAVACLMSGKVVTTYAKMPDVDTAGNSTTLDLLDGSIEYTPMQVLTALCLAVGIFQTCMWVFRLGAVSTLLSEPLVSGFTTGAAFFVLSSQLKDLFGVKVSKIHGNHKIIFNTIEVVKALPTTNLAAFIMSFVCCLVIALNNDLLKPWVAKRCRVPVPVELAVIVVGTIVSRSFDLKGNYGMSLIGEIPTGFPPFVVPPIELLPTVALDAFSITMVTYTISMSMALIFATKEKYEIDANQELLALGAGNVMGSFFSCAPICASLSRSYIQYQTGAKTCLALVVSALLVMCVLLFLAPFFEELPRCVLASIIVVSLKGMFMQVIELKRFWHLSKLDASVWLITFIVTTTINIDIGLVAGLLASVGALFMRSQKPYTCLLGRVLQTDLYLDTKRYRAAEELPGIKIFHYCGGLNFATKNIFRDSVFRKTGYLKPTEPNILMDEDNNAVKREWDPTIGNRVHCIILDASALSYVDVPGIKALLSVQKELVSSNITVFLAGANGPMLEMIERYNTLETVDRLQLDTFPTVHDAVVYYQMLEAKRDVSISVQAS